MREINCGKSTEKWAFRMTLKNDFFCEKKKSCWSISPFFPCGSSFLKSFVWKIWKFTLSSVSLITSPLYIPTSVLLLFNQQLSELDSNDMAGKTQFVVCEHTSPSKIWEKRRDIKIFFISFTKQNIHLPYIYNRKNTFVLCKFK